MSRTHRVFTQLILATSAILTILSTASAQEYRWRKDTVAVNVRNEPLEARRDEERFKDWVKTWQPSENRFVIHFRDQDREYVAWDVTMTASFTAPPEVIESGQRVTLPASISGSGQVAGGNPGMIFQYNSTDVSLQGEQTLTGGFEGSTFSGGSIAPYFDAPTAREHGEFRIYAGLWNEPPCNVMWIYRAEPIPAVQQEIGELPDAIDQQWGELIGHVISSNSGVEIVRGSERIRAWTGMPIFAGDRVVTSGSGRARLGTFSLDAQQAWTRTLQGLRANGMYSEIASERGGDWESQIPTPTRDGIHTFLNALPDDIRQDYLNTISRTGNSFDIGSNTDVGAGEVTGEGGWLAYLRRGILRRFTGSQAQSGATPKANAGIVVPATPDQDQWVRTQERWQRLQQELDGSASQAIEVDRQRHGSSWGGLFSSGARPGLLVRPQGTDFAVEYEPSANRVVVGVQQGQVECLALDAERTATLTAGQAVRVADATSSSFVPLGAGDWNTVVSMTTPPEPQQQTTTGSFPVLNGTITAIRTFESGQDLVSYEQRQYRDQFDAAGARYICWEVCLEFPRPNQRVDFSMEAVYRRADGTELFRQTLEAHVLGDWSNSIHARGWGEAQPGSWKPGQYRIDLYARGQFVGSTAFEVTGASNQGQDTGNHLSGQVTVPLIQGKVSALKFFESAFDAPAANERAFAEKFTQAGTRYVNWNLFFEYPAPDRRVEFTIDAVWYRPDGTVLARQVTPTYALPQWTGSNCSNGWGAIIPGSFALGTYRVELSVEGMQIATGHFEIVP